MDSEKRTEEYLVRAKEAEERSAASKDESSHRAWKAIADAYRYLAGSEEQALRKEARHRGDEAEPWPQGSVDEPDAIASKSVTGL